ncbi:MAG: hypothetical protein V7704_19150 [Aurantimonas endophytica]|uniref:DNA topoisomerase IV subunit B n=1 Tax=Aurantimonas endophytica TaxID=1522175 RepID=A0A7W6MN44_9HYPH|nr:hypothetical protein [Aurantimonas endophytica]MBB4001520.1 hypothetical protein [Aurantimonas endophytica]MCO6402839.1 hypothetical protein [Aurantimonas endophytica]
MTRILPAAALFGTALLIALPAFGQSTEAPASNEPAAGSASPAVPDTQAAATPAETATDPAVAAAIEALSPLVEDVQIVGPWSEGERQGVWRTVMVQSPADETGYHFFVQQLEGSGTDHTVRATTEITEINQVDGAIVGYRADEPSPDAPSGLTLFFDILPADGEIAETYELHFAPDAPYMFGPASN